MESKDEIVNDKSDLERGEDDEVNIELFFLEIKFLIIYLFHF